MKIKNKTLHLEFVLLSLEEFAKLCELLTPAGAAHWIEELNDYLGLSEKNRKKYDSHYHAIRRWARLEAKNQKPGARSQESGENYERAADRFVADLKEHSAWPDMSPRTRTIVYAVLLKRQQPWAAVRKALIEDPTIAAKLKEEFITEAKKK